MGTTEEHLADIAARLTRDGRVVFRGVRSEEAVGRLARVLGTIRAHRDSDPGGRTLIAERPDVGASASRAFSTGPLAPHTDGSGVPCPADLVVTYVKIAPAYGGRAVFVDGDVLLERLAREHPDILTTIQDTTAFRFGADGLVVPILSEPNGTGRRRLRYRDDGELAALSSSTAHAVGVLRSVISQLATSMALTAGDGYVVDNRRYLHGRTAFVGRREVVRYLVDAPHLCLGVTT